eukprot:gene20371-23377_t
MGFDIAFRVFAVDPTGVLVTHDEDAGNDARIHEFELVNGTTELFPIAYNGAYSGPARFFLTSEPAPAPYKFLAEMIFQRLDRISIVGVSCDINPRGEGKDFCTLPGVYERDLNVTTLMSLQVMVVDPLGKAVRSDDRSVIRIQSRCGDDDRSSYIGRPAYIDGAYDGSIVDVVVPLRYPARGGVTTAGPMTFSGPCSNMALVVFCEHSGVKAADGGCEALRPVHITGFPVTLGNAAPPELIPPPPPLRVNAALRYFYGDTLEETVGAFSEWANAITAVAFGALLGHFLASEIQQVRRVDLLWLCVLPEYRAYLGPTVNDRATAGGNKTTGDGGYCVQKMEDDGTGTYGDGWTTAAPSAGPTATPSSDVPSMAPGPTTGR